MWKKVLAKKCKDLKIENVVENDGLSVTLRCSEIPDKHIQTDIESIVPNSIKCNFIESPKTATIEAIKNTLLLKGTHSINNRKLIIKTSKLSQSELLDIKEIVNSDSYFSSYEIIGINLLTNEIEYNNTLREKVINSDDILNLTILLNTTNTVVEFIKGI